MTNRDSNWWREECNYISSVTDKKGRVKEMNNDPAIFRRYAEMQRDLAESDGAYDAATYIQQCIDDLPVTRKRNPLTRIKRKDIKTQPSQSTGEPPSARLIKRRQRTANQIVPGIYANPLVRVKSRAADSQRPRKTKTARGRVTETKSPSRRLLKRRDYTDAAPAGFYANPKDRRYQGVYVDKRDGGFEYGMDAVTPVRFVFTVNKSAPKFAYRSWALPANVISNDHFQSWARGANGQVFSSLRNLQSTIKKISGI